jgi:hypothetical protein
MTRKLAIGPTMRKEVKGKCITARPLSVGTVRLDFVTTSEGSRRRDGGF